MTTSTHLAKSLGTYLESWQSSHVNEHPLCAEVVQTVTALAEAGRQLSAIIALGDLAADTGIEVAINADGDDQKELDVQANDLIVELLADQPVAWLASEELDEVLALKEHAPLAVTVDPLDGSSNVDTNLSVGTIFSIYEVGSLGEASVLKSGRHQLAAGYIIYGPQTSLVLTLGDGSHIFTLDRELAAWYLVQEHVQIPLQTREFAINGSNFRHWDEPVRDYIEDCLDGDEGVRGANFNTRWLASLVAECHRILSRGGVFLYPADKRTGYGEGRLRLVYEANAIAWLVEQACGYASTGSGPILDVEPTSVHQRIPLIFGSTEEVARVEEYYLGTQAGKRRSPLFTNRGLFAGKGQ